MNEVYLCLGGNLGNCLENLDKARRLITGKAGMIIRQSCVYQSQAWGMGKSPDFFNQVVKVKTKLAAQELIIVLLEIEKMLGRERIEAIGYQNRILDIDILFFNDVLIKTGELEIPHPRLHLRNFVLMPLEEIASDFMHPAFKKTIAQLLQLSPDKGKIKKLAHAI